MSCSRSIINFVNSDNLNAYFGKTTHNFNEIYNLNSAVEANRITKVLRSQLLKKSSISKVRGKSSYRTSRNKMCIKYSSSINVSSRMCKATIRNDKR